MKKRVCIVTFLWVAISLSSSGCGALPILLATATPTSTSTLTSTPTPQSTATATATATPLATGVQAIKQTDGSTLVVDYEDNFQFALGSGWLVLTIARGRTPTIAMDQEFLNQSGLDDDAVANFLNLFDLHTIPALAILRDRQYDANGVPANISVDVHDYKSQAALPIDKLVAAAQSNQKRDNAEILKSRRAASPNPNGVEFGTWDALVPQSATPARLAFVFFKSDGKLCLITLYTASQFADQLSPTIDMVISTLKLLGP